MSTSAHGEILPRFQNICFKFPLRGRRYKSVWPHDFPQTFAPRLYAKVVLSLLWAVHRKFNIQNSLAHVVLRKFSLQLGLVFTVLHFVTSTVISRLYWLL